MNQTVKFGCDVFACDEVPVLFDVNGEVHELFKKLIVAVLVLRVRKCDTKFENFKGPIMHSLQAILTV